MNRQQTEGLIELYESHPCLWKTTHPDYTNKNLRLEAYKKLVEFAKPFERECTIAQIKAKIQNLRTTFRKEWKKVSLSQKKSGSGTAEVHKPRLWYYTKMQFVLDDEMPLPSIEIGAGSEDYHVGDGLEDSYEGDSFMGSQEWGLPTGYEEEVQTPVAQDIATGSQEGDMSIDPQEQVEKPTRPFSSRRLSAQKRKAEKKKEDDLLDACSGTLKRIEERRVGDTLDAAGQRIAARLRDLEPDQRVLAEDLISSVLRNAHFKKLTEESTICGGGCMLYAGSVATVLPSNSVEHSYSQNIE